MKGDASGRIFIHWPLSRAKLRRLLFMDRNRSMPFDQPLADEPTPDNPEAESRGLNKPESDNPDSGNLTTTSFASTNRAAGLLSEALHSTSAEILIAAAGDPALTEDFALALLKRIDLPAQALAQLSKNVALLNSSKVKVALVEHPATPRHVSITMVRQLFTFDLMQVALTPVVPADIKRAAEESLISRLERLSHGERLSLAHRASRRVAAQLLLDPQPRVIQAALQNSRLTDAAVIQAVMHNDASAALIVSVCQDSKWSAQREIRMALLHHAATPLDRALEFERSLPATVAREILHDSHMSAAMKEYLLNDIKERGEASRGINKC